MLIGGGASELEWLFWWALAGGATFESTAKGIPNEGDVSLELVVERKIDMQHGISAFSIRR